jgi:predicted nucleotidyltransferase/predicted transcriptional regulator
METDIQKKYKDAVDCLVEKLKEDKTVTAVILFGSLAYDKVWEKSDVDMTVVVRDDQKLTRKSYCIDEDDIVINVDLMTRADFVKWANKAVGGGFSHSLITRGVILFTRDEGLRDILNDASKMGKTDMEKSVFYKAENLVSVMGKCEKWLKVKNDVTYSRYYLVHMANVIAGMELCLNYVSPGREAILQAAELNPALMERFYAYPMNNVLSREQITELLNEADDYLMKHIDIVCKPINEFLRSGDDKTVTAMSKYLNLGGHSLTHLTEYLKNKGLIGKSTANIRITPKGRLIAEEIAYYRLDDDEIFDDFN